MRVQISRATALVSSRLIRPSEEPSAAASTTMKSAFSIAWELHKSLSSVLSDRKPCLTSSLKGARQESSTSALQRASGVQSPPLGLLIG